MNITKKIISGLNLFIFLSIIWTLYYYNSDLYQPLNNKYITEKELLIDILDQDNKNYKEDSVDEGNKEGVIEEKDYLLSVGYARNHLSASEQIVYDSMGEKSLQHVTSFNITPISEESLFKIFTAFINDNPEFFWVKNIKYYVDSHSREVVKIDMIYNVTKAEREIRQAQIDNVVNGIINELNNYQNNYDKVKYVYDYIVKNTTYDINASDSQNIYSVFVNQRSVCAGYARSFQYIMNKINVFSLYVTGKITVQNDGDIGHAWNMVRLDNSYYNIDVTWGDSTFNAGNEKIEGYISYHYFNITDQELLTTHIIDNHYPLPKAEGFNYNYYNHENLLFNDYDSRVKNRLIEDILSKNAKKERVLTIKFNSLAAYQKAVGGLFEKKELMTVIKAANNRVSNKVNDKSAKYYLSADKLIIDIIIDYL